MCAKYAEKKVILCGMQNIQEKQLLYPEHTVCQSNVCFAPSVSILFPCSLNLSTSSIVMLKTLLLSP